MTGDVCSTCYETAGHPAVHIDAYGHWPTKHVVPDERDVTALSELLDLMAEFRSNDQRARYLLTCNWMRDRGAVAAAVAATYLADEQVRRALTTGVDLDVDPAGVAPSTVTGSTSDTLAGSSALSGAGGPATPREPASYYRCERCGDATFRGLCQECR